LIHINPQIDALVLPLLSEELYIYCHDLASVVFQMQYFIDTIIAAITEGYIQDTLNDKKEFIANIVFLVLFDIPSTRFSILNDKRDDFKLMVYMSIKEFI
jgi:hypothetical protein